MNTYSRRAHFDYFRSLQNPMLGVTVDVDVTDLVRICREKGWSFYLAFIHIAAQAANAVPELRQRIRGEGIVEYDRCGTSHVELLEDGTYCYCTLYHDPDQSFSDYMAAAAIQRERARAGADIEEDEDVEGLLFMTSVPWLHYTQLTQPTAGPSDTNPRISWGRYATDHQGRLQMPLTILCHHSLVDGLQLAQFYQNLDREIAVLCAR
jgi:chloramphenicol O-acetyltransferase type A